jgi:small subunit ribosomal protein S15
MLTKRVKTKIIKDFQAHEKDTGSAEVQVGILSRRIEELSDHLKKNPKDKHSRRGLLKLINKRRKFLNYIKKNNPDKYAKIAKKLGI